MRNSLLAVLLALSLGAAPMAVAEEGLVAHWNFDSIIDDQVPDLSGNNNLGRNHGAKQVKRGDGYALSFDGLNDYVDCGNDPSLRLQKAVSISAWVFPDARPTNEPAIVMKEDPEVYGLTMYKDGRCYWYVSGGGNKTPNPGSAPASGATSSAPTTAGKSNSTSTARCAPPASSPAPSSRAATSSSANAANLPTSSRA